MTTVQEHLKAIQQKSGWTKLQSTPQMVASWQSFIVQCEDSYNLSIYEYENDLSIRSRIELMLSQTEFRSDPAVEYMAQQVAKLDTKFRALLLNVKALEARKEWWRRGVLRFAGEEYARDVFASYGIRIEVR